MRNFANPEFTSSCVSAIRTSDPWLKRTTANALIIDNELFAMSHPLIIKLVVQQVCACVCVAALWEWLIGLSQPACLFLLAQINSEL